jgi:ATP-dependent RNA helicase DeaD
MKTFNELGISDALAKILKNKKYLTATEIQEQTIPLILSGRDIIGQAETGSGKTAACAIPIIQRTDPAIKSIQSIILTPTRELALQYLDEVSRIATPYGLKPFVVYGGFDIDIQMAKLKDGVNILVATPGRLGDIIYNRRLSLENVKTFVIDEADEMLKMGFIEDIDFIKSCVVREHQTLLFSATMPEEIKRISKKYQKDAVHVKLNRKRVQPKTLTHATIRVSSRNKDKALKAILGKEEINQAIIFCNTRRGVKELFDGIRKTSKKIDFLHGGLDQNVRTRIMGKFRSKRIQFLITTDVMSRGIDISGVSHIINYNLPVNPEIYVHRSGRTARLGKKGICISMLTSRSTGMFTDIKDKLGLSVEHLSAERFLKGE